MFTKYIETTVHCSKHSQCLESSFDVIAPIRENIPTLNSFASVDSLVENVAREAILGFGIHAILLNQSEKITELETSLTDKLNNSFPRKSIFDFWNNQTLSLPEQDRIIAKIILNLQHENISPQTLTLAGLRFFDWANQSKFKKSLILQIANWLRSNWARVIERQKFQLLNPTITTPPISRCLDNPRSDAGFIAELLLVTSDATDLLLASQYRDKLKEIIPH